MDTPKTNSADAAGTIGVALAAAAAVIGLVFFTAQGMTAAHEEGTKRIEACVAEGGTWIDVYKMCLASGAEAK